MAAVAIVAVAAVMLLAGGGPAQATTGTLSSDGNDRGNAPQRPDLATTHATPEPCPGETGNDYDAAAEVVNSGHIALFDVYWNPDEKELTNNPCPPTVVHVPEDDDGNPASNVRTASNINIEETIIHIPNSAKVVLSDSGTYTETNYREVWEADAKENRSGGGAGDGIVWALPACPDGALTDSLCVAFSADLLDPADWGLYKDEVTAAGPVEFLVDHAHQHDVGEQGGRYVLVYHDDATAPYEADWNTSDADLNLMDVMPDEYEHPTWFFTRAGRYEFQVHVKGYPEATRDDGMDPVSTDDSVTSDVREYYFHVGLMADLNVEVSAAESDTGVAPLEPGDQVTITVTAGNVGPDTGESTKVDVSLPEGLVYSSHTTDTTDTIDCPDPNGGTATQESYCPGTGVWAVGDLGVTDDGDDTTTDADAPTLTIMATVAEGTRGQDLTVAADIYATEHLSSIDVVELDPRSDDNTAAYTITPQAVPNVDPLFQVNRSVVENSAEGTDVGDPVLVKEPDAHDAEDMVLTLAGDGAGNFDADFVDGDAQITVANGAHLNYEHKNSYDLVMTISDSTDPNGNPDSVTDNSIAVNISLVDVTEEITATVEVTKHSGYITWAFDVEDPPQWTNAVFRFSLRNSSGLLISGSETHMLADSVTITDNYPYPPGTYSIEGEIQYDADGTTYTEDATVIGNTTITFP